ncbi:MAG: aquaporin [Fimbriimonas sp.]
MKPRVVLAEFIGTFALIFVGVLVVANLSKADAGLIGIALGHGLTIACMVWATSAISGGHLNPVVSFALYVAKKIDGITLAYYWTAQMLGALAAAFLLKEIAPGDTSLLLSGSTPSFPKEVGWASAMLLEAVATFFLVFVIFSTTIDRRSNRMAALFIGLTVTIGIFAIGPFTGAALNPARYLGPAIAAGNLTDWYVYLGGPLVGAVAVALIFSLKTLHVDEFPEATDERIVTVEHVPSETPAKSYEPMAAPADAEPVISSDPPRHLSGAFFSHGEPQPYVPSAPVTPTFTEPGVAPDGRLNFSAIYRMGNLPEVPFTAEQVLQMVEALPGDLPMQSKRAAISVTLQTMARSTGASAETVLADASRKMQALASFAETYTEQANQYILKTQHEIETMEAEIERRQRGIEESTQKQSQMVEACQSEADRIEKVFDYFEERPRQ